MRMTLSGNIIILRPRGYLTGGDETDELDKQLNTTLDNPTVKCIIIDCADVRSFNATALGVLMSAHMTATRSSRRLMFAKVNKTVANIFETTRLNLIFDVYPTVELAIAALAQPRRAT